MLFTVLLKFRSDKGRDPQPAKFTEDSERLLQLCEEVLQSKGLQGDLLPEDFTRWTYYQLSLHNEERKRKKLSGSLNNKERYI